MAINLEEAVNQAVLALNSEAADELVWWTEEELYDHANQALQDLGKTVQAFVTFLIDDSGHFYFQTTPYESEYPQPDRHMQTLMMNCGLSGQARVLLPRTVSEMQARYGGEWEILTGDPTHYIVDMVETTKIWLWPKPTRGLIVGQFFQTWPRTIAANETEPGPAIFQDMAEWFILAETRGREGKGAMPDVANWARQMVAGLTRICTEYWGRAQ